MQQKMRKRWVDGGVQCRFYCSEDTQRIRCSGVEDGNWIHMVWASKRDKLDYKHTFCKNDPEGCPVAEMLAGK